MRTKESYQKKQFAPHSETDKKQSWYWNVLVKNTGSWENAKKDVDRARKHADLYYDLGLRIRI